MENADPNADTGGVTTRSSSSSASSPPPPPDPAADTSAAGAPEPAKDAKKSDQPLRLEGEEWDITSVSALAALRMLMESMETLAEATGDIPPTPPVSRPTTPRREAVAALQQQSQQQQQQQQDSPPTITIGSPEAHPHEAITVPAGPHNTEEAHHIQHAAIARRFFSKTAPGFGLGEYLARLHQWCPHSAGVYLAAAAYVQRLCVADLAVPATRRTVHRLALAAIRVAAKVLEDHKWPQDRVARVGGVAPAQLLSLEVTLCFLLDFDLWVDARLLARRMFLLQQAARHGAGARGPRLSESFRLNLPLRRKLTKGMAAAAAAAAAAV